MKIIKFIDLFAGMGGIRIGFEQAAKNLGYNSLCVFSSDIKASSKKVYMENFFEIQEADDITKIHEKDIPDFDYLLGGFPCQAFSSAGKKLGFDDTRGTLFFDIARILKEKKPRGFILENVEGLYNHDGGKTFEVIKNTLVDLGYNIDYKILDSKDFGLAQSRKRVYIIGDKNRSISIDKNIALEYKDAILKDVLETNVPLIQTKFTDLLLKYYSIEELMGKSIKDKRGGPNNIHSWDFDLKGHTTPEQKILLNTLFKERRKKKWANEIGIDWMDGMPLTLEQIKSFYNVNNLKFLLDDLVTKKYLKLEHPKKLESGIRIYDKTKEKGYNIISGKLSFEFSKILSPYEITPTLVATDLSKLGVPDIEKNGIRRLTKRELLRLFGYPDTYEMNSVNINEAYDLLGNTVCVPIIKELALTLIQEDTKNGRYSKY